ncbi:MAG: Cupredoxin, partial [Piptocephalis tieghemiana]
NADCTAKTGLMINGASPGPAITATQGDLVVVTVSNGHTQGVTVHFHGVTQKGTPFADGVPGLSQVAIPPGGTYEYRWRARNSGTYFYHAHTRFDASSVYGAIIIHDPKETLVYDDERVLLLNDYWHKDDDALYQGVMGSPMQWIGTPDAILLNGRTQGSGGPNVPSTDASTCGYSNISVSPGKTYRLRIVNAGGWSYLAVTIAGHAMTMVEADGHRTIPMPVNRIEIAPGQRYSVLLKADQAASSYWIRADPSWGPENSAKNGAALLTYEGSSPITSSPPPAVNMTAQEIPDWILPQVQSALTNPVMPEKADDTLTLTISPITQGSAIQKYAVNNVSYSDTASSSGKALLDMVYEDMQASRPAGSSISSNPSLITYPKDTVLDIIIQLDARSCLDAHPWHLHGHSYWDLGQGVGLYTAAEGAKAVPKSPLYRDTTMVFPQKDAGGANGCGWRRIRVKLDNPGIWPIHCHIHAHMIMGMMSVL